MKKIIFAAMAAAVTITSLASCTKHTETDVDLPATSGAGDSPQVQLALGSDAASRAFFDDTATAEAWEREVSSLEIYAYDPSGNLITRHIMSASEIAAKSARFPLPHSAVGTVCSFYVAANTAVGELGSVTRLDNLVADMPYEYNGTFEEVSKKSKRKGGFTMTGKATARIAGGDSYTTVNVSLRRLVAKIAVRTSIDEAFIAANNGGTVFIDQAKILNAASETYFYFRQDVLDTHSDTNYWAGQTSAASGKYFDNLFYIYENCPRPVEDRVRLTLSGWFDADGNAATTVDRTGVEYTMTLDGSGNGEIRRNGYYRVSATIKGLAGDGVALTCTVADWETPVTQTVDLGN